jgi:oligopeptide transport system substrate-binding protein
LLLFLSISHPGCLTGEHVDPYYGRVVVPNSQDFRWIDGGLPQTFDPAFAAAPPDTDVIRAIFEGLTEYEPRTLTPVPAVATRWESANGGRMWTFYLREDARWSNGDPVTANDFVRSWKRTVKIGELAPHTELLSNIEGANAARLVSFAQPPGQTSDETERKTQNSLKSRPEQKFGAEAIAVHVLRVHLQRPDMNFPALVAHPVFRPVKMKEGESVAKIGPAELISNGAFLLSKTEPDRVLLARADNYWGKSEVRLERVAFIGANDAESALAAYHAGEVDAVTNAAFEPLALKLLAPYQDFRRATYGALTYYSFNTAHPPFDDVRVREALAIAIDRERISEDDMGGATEPAKKFLPDLLTGPLNPVVGKSELLEKDSKRAKELLAEAGFLAGKGFPRIRLLINRNEQQRVVAQSIAAMWRSSLNIETEIVVRNWDDYEAAVRAGDYDVVRRGIVMQTTDELTNLRMLFQTELEMPLPSAQKQQSPARSANESANNSGSAASETRVSTFQPIETERQALNELKAMPIYFACSYALVKPYVAGFDANVLDAPSLKRVRIEANWREAKSAR